MKGFSIYSATYEKSPTIWWIKSHNSGMKIRNFTIKYTDHKIINSNNWNLKWIGQGVLKLERGMRNRRTDSRTLVYHNTSRLKDGRIKTMTTYFIVGEEYPPYDFIKTKTTSIHVYVTRNTHHNIILFMLYQGNLISAQISETIHYYHYSFLNTCKCGFHVHFIFWEKIIWVIGVYHHFQQLFSTISWLLD